MFTSSRLECQMPLANLSHASLKFKLQTSVLPFKQRSLPIQKINIKKTKPTMFFSQFQLPRFIHVKVIIQLKGN